MVLNGIKYSNLLKISSKKYNDSGNIGYFLEVNIKYPEQLGMSHNDLLFLFEKNENRTM